MGATPGCGLCLISELLRCSHLKRQCSLVMDAGTVSANSDHSSYTFHFIPELAFLFCYVRSQ